MIRMTTIRAKKEFDRMLEEVEDGERFVLEEDGEAVAAIVSVEDLALLEAIENRHDLEEARRTLAEVAEKAPSPGNKSRPSWTVDAPGGGTGASVLITDARFTSSAPPRLSAGAITLALGNRRCTAQHPR